MIDFNRLRLIADEIATIGVGDKLSRLDASGNPSIIREYSAIKEPPYPFLTYDVRHVGGEAAFHVAAQVRGIHRTIGQRFIHLGFERVIGARVDRLVKAVIAAGGIAVANQAEAGVCQVDRLGITKAVGLARQGFGFGAHVVAYGMGHIQ